MIIGVQGTTNFFDYSVFLSGMGAALYRMNSDDKVFTVFSAGPYNLNAMAQEFINVSNFKARGIKAKLVKVPPSWFNDNFDIIDRFAFFANEKEHPSSVAKFLDTKDIDVQVYRYHQLAK
jgi:hypothetical protein